MNEISFLHGIPLTTIVGFAIAIGSLIVAILRYLRGSRADDDARDTAETALINAGYSGLIERYQEENKELRRRVEVAEQRITTLLKEMEGA